MFIIINLVYFYFNIQNNYNFDISNFYLIFFFQSQILSERVTLIGHKPFLGIVDMVLLENKLVIFTSANLNEENK